MAISGFNREAWVPDVGDVVRIREWDEMEEEYGVGDWGAIQCKFTFTEGMSNLCGKVFTIVDISRRTRKLADRAYKLDPYIQYAISKDMLEPYVVDEGQYNIEEENDFVTFLDRLTVV